MKNRVLALLKDLSLFLASRGSHCLNNQKKTEKRCCVFKVNQKELWYCQSTNNRAMADLGEGPGGPSPPPLFWVKKKK